MGDVMGNSRSRGIANLTATAAARRMLVAQLGVQGDHESAQGGNCTTAMLSLLRSWLWGAVGLSTQRGQN